MPNSFTADGDGVNDLFGPVVHGADHSYKWKYLIVGGTGISIYQLKY